MVLTIDKPQLSYSNSQSALLDAYNSALAALSPEQIYSRYPHNFRADATGKLRGMPPFRESKSGTSFTVFPDKGFFDAGDGFAGSAADYIHSLNIGRWERAKGKDFVAAVKELCGLANIPFPERAPTPQEIEKATKEEIRRAILAATIKICSDVLWSDYGSVARQYLIEERGLTQQHIKDFNLGYYRKRSDVVDYLKHKGFTANEIKDAAVALSKWEGYIVIPWLDEHGRPLTLYGRYHQKVAPDGLPKTLALPGTSTKRSPLYLDRALAANHREVIFVEGVFDALLLQALGETRVISGLAASFSNEQIETLHRNRIEKVYHLGDPDGGGIGGTNSNLLRLTREGISVYVPPTLPDGLDPDEFVIREGIEALKELINQSEHAFRWKAKQIVWEYGTYTDAKIEKILKEAYIYSRTIPEAYKLEAETFFWNTISRHLGELDAEAFRAKLEARYSNSSPYTGDKENLGLPTWAASDIAKWLAERYRPQLAWNTKIEEWYRYGALDEVIWSKDPKYYIWQVIITELETLADITQQLDEKKKRPTYSSNFVIGIETLLKAHLPVREWDETEGLLPFKNGVKNLVTGEFSPHSPGFRLTWCLPYDYDPQTTCEPIIEWLKVMTNGDEQIIQFIRAHLNAIITSRVDIQSYLELIGPGGTGKGTITRLATALIGDRNTISTTLRNLEENRFDTARLYNARLVVITDAEKWGGDVSVLKALTGEDKLRYEEKYKQPRDGFYFRGRVLICANEPIATADYTSGLERRRQTVYMTNKIPLSSQKNLISLNNKGVTGEFVSYLPGLMNWVLEMSSTEVETVIKETPTFHHQFQHYKAQILCATNPLADWMDVSLVIRNNYRTAIGVANRDKSPDSPHWFLKTDEWLYANYAEYCHGSGAKPVSVRRFVDLLHDLSVNQLNLNITKGRDRYGSYVLGLKIRGEDDHDPLLISGSTPPPEPPSGGTSPRNPDHGSPNAPNSVTKNNNPPPCDGMVTDVVTAQTLTGDECDGCDGLRSQESQLENSVVQKVENPEISEKQNPAQSPSQLSPKLSQSIEGDELQTNSTYQSQPVTTSNNPSQQDLDPQTNELIKNWLTPKFEIGDVVQYVGKDSNCINQYGGQDLVVFKIDNLGFGGIFYALRGAKNLVTTWLEEKDLKAVP